MSTYTSGLLDFNFSQEEIDVTKGRRYPCSISASVSGVNLVSMTAMNDFENHIQRLSPEV
jgi:hypothetical protein